MASWEEIRNGIFAGESGGDYNALFGYANRPGGQFSNVQVSDMSVNDVMRFTDPSGPYAQTVKGQIGRVATPVGAYQIVGKTLRGAVKALGLTGDERFDRATQDALGQYILSTQGTGAWEGYRGPQSQAPQGGTPMMGLLSTGMPEQPQTFGQRIKSGFQDGSLFDSMAMAFNGLRMNPDDNLGRVVGQRQEMRQQEDVMNRTVAWLQSMGTPQAMQAAEALATGSIDAGSAVQYALAKADDGRTALQQNIEYMMQTQNMSFDDAMRAVQGASGGTSISLGSNGIEYGDAPKDMAWARNPDGTVKLDDRGIPVAMPIQATKLATEADAAAAAAAQKAQNAGVYGDAAIMAIDQLIGGPGQAGMIDDGAGVFNVSNVGIVGDRLAKMGLSQSAVDVANTLAAVTSNIAFGRLQAMRDASVTGGALGSVTENELNMLMNSLGAVKPDTSPELLRKNLATIKNIWTKINSDPVARSFYYGAGGQGAAPAAGGVAAGDGFTVTGQF